MAQAGPSPHETEVVTDRSKQWAREDEQFVPVIVKRSDEARRHPDNALENAVREGFEQFALS